MDEDDKDYLMELLRKHFRVFCHSFVVHPGAAAQETVSKMLDDDVARTDSLTIFGS